MKKVILRLLLGLLGAWLMMPSAPPVGARPQQPTDGIGRLMLRLEQIVKDGVADRYLDLVAGGADMASARAFAQANVRANATRVVVRERDRVELGAANVRPGFRLAVDVFSEFDRRAQLATWNLDVVPKTTTDGDDDWAISGQEVVSAFGALYKLALGARQFAAKNVVLKGVDVELRLPEGSVFTAETEDGPTVLLLVGSGQMIFRPTPTVERQQLRIFARAEVLDTPFTAAFVRIAPSALGTVIAGGTIAERTPDAAQARTATALFRADNAKSFGVDLGDLTTEAWSLVPTGADMVAEIHTKKFGVLSYVRSTHEAEDVSLFDRAGKRNISVYASPAKLAQRGPFYDDDDEQDYEPVHYDIDASFDPRRESVEGVGRMTIRTRAQTLNAVTIRLAESLGVGSVVSREFGRLTALRVRNQNAVLVNLPKPVPKGTVLAFTVAYRGRLTPQAIDSETVTLGQQTQTTQTQQPQTIQAPERQEAREDTPAIALEPSYLYSNHSYWYPQAATSTYATATLRVKVPAGYACVASGDPNPETADLLSRPLTGTPELVFRAVQPVRYLSVLIARLSPVRSQMLAGVITDAQSSQEMTLRDGVFYKNIELTTLAAPRLRGRGQALTERAADIVRFYGSLIGDCPYPRLTLTIVERELPGGHSPAYLAVVSQPVLPGQVEWRSDPASFPEFPEYFLAHEIAHQWWGQAVGWKNYHEQWLSEGLAQYFATLYAERLRGKGVFDSVVRRLQEWAVKKSGEGPVYLGYRIGHVKREPQLFRAIVYNKSAAVLHMLRRLLGDDAFFRGLRRFYQEYRFRKAGSDDLRRAFEAESQQPLARFFDRWIYDSQIPRLKFSHRTERDAAGGADAVVLHFEQLGDVFDVPITVTLEYEDRTTSNVLVKLTEPVAETRVLLKGKLHAVTVNGDRAAVARIEK